MRSRWLLVAISTAGCVIMFLISAQRTVILLPPAIALVCFALNKSQLMCASSFLLTALSVSVFLCCAWYEHNIIVGLIATLLVFRTIALPGLTFSQYHDLFANDGFTWWSHIKGLNLLIPAPSSYEMDAAWPNLGYLVGERLYGNIELDANANLFSGDGVAAAGPFGVIVIGLIFAVWLNWLDRASRGWNRSYAMLVILPVALSLTNGHFFTTLLSFGGLFWMLTFYLYKPRGSSACTRCGSRRRTPVNIVMLCDFFNESLEYQENLLVKYYVKHGHAVTVITSTFDSVFDYYSDRHDNCWPARDYEHGGARIIKLRYRYNFMNRLRAFTSIHAILEQAQPNLIYVHDIIPNVLEAIAYEKRHPQCRMILDYHADYSNSGRSWLSIRVLHGVIRNGSRSGARSSQQDISDRASERHIPVRGLRRSVCGDGIAAAGQTRICAEVRQRARRPCAARVPGPSAGAHCDLHRWKAVACQAH